MNQESETEEEEENIDRQRMTHAEKEEGAEYASNQSYKKDSCASVDSSEGEPSDPDEA